jgi:cytidylate kinase
MKSRSLQQIVEGQAQRWQLAQKEPPETPKAPVITISREPGSGGSIIAEMLATQLKLDLFHQKIIHGIAESAQVHLRVLQTLDEKGMNVLEEWISSLVNERHLWPDEYLKHLMKLVGIIGRHGGAVLVGRGGNFILPPENRLRVRVIAPMQVRIENVSRQYGVSKDEAKRRIIRTESDRRAFIRKYFNADIIDPIHYDLTVNTAILGMEGAVRAIRGALGK